MLVFSHRNAVINESPVRPLQNFSECCWIKCICNSESQMQLKSIVLFTESYRQVKLTCGLFSQGDSTNSATASHMTKRLMKPDDEKLTWASTWLLEESVYLSIRKTSISGKGCKISTLTPLFSTQLQLFH